LPTRHQPSCRDYRLLHFNSSQFHFLLLEGDPTECPAGVVLEALVLELGVLFAPVLLVVPAQGLALLKGEEEEQPEVEVDVIERTSQYLRQALWMPKWIATFLTEQPQKQT